MLIVNISDDSKCFPANTQNFDLRDERKQSHGEVFLICCTCPFYLPSSASCRALPFYYSFQPLSQILTEIGTDQKLEILAPCNLWRGCILKGDFTGKLFPYELGPSNYI